MRSFRLFHKFCFYTLTLLLAAAFPLQTWAAPAKPHVISFGRWISVEWYAGVGEEKQQTLKARALVVDGHIKEYTLGLPHEVTDRLFVVRRVFRVNDSLPDEQGTPHWQWQRGGWLMVDRVTARVSPVALPEFDALYSSITWYRDYAAYCGISDDGKKVYAMVAQLSRRKPVLKKAISIELPGDDAPPDSACPSPAWQRAPMRVTFDLTGGSKQTFAIRGHVVDLVNDAEEDEEASK